MQTSQSRNAQIAYQLQYLMLKFYVQMIRRFIKQQYGWLLHQSACNIKSLQLTT